MISRYYDKFYGSQKLVKPGDNGGKYETTTGNIPSEEASVTYSGTDTTHTYESVRGSINSDSVRLVDSQNVFSEQPQYSDAWGQGYKFDPQATLRCGCSRCHYAPSQGHYGSDTYSDYYIKGNGNKFSNTYDGHVQPRTAASDTEATDRPRTKHKNEQNTKNRRSTEPRVLHTDKGTVDGVSVDDTKQNFTNVSRNVCQCEQCNIIPHQYRGYYRPHEHIYQTPDVRYNQLQNHDYRYNDQEPVMCFPKPVSGDQNTPVFTKSTLQYNTFQDGTSLEPKSTSHHRSHRNTHNTLGTPQTYTHNTFGTPQAHTHNTLGTSHAHTHTTRGTPHSHTHYTFGSPQSYTQDTFGTPQSQSPCAEPEDNRVIYRVPSQYSTDHYEPICNCHIKSQENIRGNCNVPRNCSPIQCVCEVCSKQEARRTFDAINNLSRGDVSDSGKDQSTAYQSDVLHSDDGSERNKRTSSHRSSSISRDSSFSDSNEKQQPYKVRKLPKTNGSLYKSKFAPKR